MQIFQIERGVPLWFINGKRFSIMVSLSWFWPFVTIRRGHRVAKEKP